MRGIRKTGAKRGGEEFHELRSKSSCPLTLQPTARRNKGSVENLRLRQPHWIYRANFDGLDRP